MITVILTQDVQGCGRRGDVCTVSDGFARNNLLRHKRAVIATPAQIARHRAQQEEREAQRRAQAEAAERITRLLDGKTITVSAKHDGNTLFAAIDATQIASELSALIDETVSPDVIVIDEAIKTLGDHTVRLRFDSEHIATVRVTVTGA